MIQGTFFRIPRTKYFLFVNGKVPSSFRIQYRALFWGLVTLGFVFGIFDLWVSKASRVLFGHVLALGFPLGSVFGGLFGLGFCEYGVWFGRTVWLDPELPREPGIGHVFF